MNKNLRVFFSGLLLLVGLGLFYLTNKGVLSFEKAAIFQISSELPAQYPPVAIDQVNLVPMDSERVIENQTVIVRDGLIETIGDSDQVTIPENAVIVDGEDKYLIPGLVDMHVHIESENDILLFVANGVTSVRNMWGNTGKKLQVGLPDQLQLRRQIEQGALLGPTIYTAGPIMEGRPSFHPLAEVFTTPEEAVQSIAWQKAQGYDFTKVYDNLSPEVYAAIIAAGREDYAQRIAGLNRRMVQALHEEGAGILLGTDSAQFYHIPGFSIHEELALLVGAGLTPYEALEGGTRNAALVLGRLDEFGTLTAGKRADMILLGGNPLEDVSNVQKRAGVMVNGRWFSEEQLQSLLSGLVESYRPTLFDRLWPLLFVIGALAMIVGTMRQSSQTS